MSSYVYSRLFLSSDLGFMFVHVICDLQCNDICIIWYGLL